MRWPSGAVTLWTIAAGQRSWIVLRDQRPNQGHPRAGLISHATITPAFRGVDTGIPHWRSASRSPAATGGRERAAEAHVASSVT